MEEEKTFNKLHSDIDNNKKRFRKFACDLHIDEYAEIHDFLKKYNITKVGFVRESFKKLKDELDNK